MNAACYFRLRDILDVIPQFSKITVKDKKGNILFQDKLGALDMELNKYMERAVCNVMSIDKDSLYILVE